MIKGHYWAVFGVMGPELGPSIGTCFLIPACRLALPGNRLTPGFGWRVGATVVTFELLTQGETLLLI
jgi:hypothetical protein